LCKFKYLLSILFFKKTEKLQLWHVQKPSSDEPLLVSDINFIKHDPERKEKHHSLGAAIQRHNLFPKDTDSGLTESKIRRFVHGFNCVGADLPVLMNISRNDCQPIRSASSNNDHIELLLIEEMWENVEKTPVSLHQSIDEIEGGHSLKQVIEVNLEKAQDLEAATRFEKWCLALVIKI
jgi:hypothetical protein